MHRPRPRRSPTGCKRRLDTVAATAARNAAQPKVYFEEWNDPLISGICWVSELIEVAGGIDAFPDLRREQGAKQRIIDPAAVVVAAPDIILASWCGKKVRMKDFYERPGWTDIPAVRNNRIVEIKSPIILQPGPAALTDGLDAICAALAEPNANARCGQRKSFVIRSAPSPTFS